VGWPNNKNTIMKNTAQRAIPERQARSRRSGPAWSRSCSQRGCQPKDGGVVDRRPQEENVVRSAEGAQALGIDSPKE
jgi:hypothetical protein